MKVTDVASKLCVSSSGEFGSVMEGLLTQEESVLKVAVKTMKSEQTTEAPKDQGRHCQNDNLGQKIVLQIERGRFPSLPQF